MFICNNCERTFEEPKTAYNSVPYGMGYANEKWSVCPYCNDNDFTEAEECEMCGEACVELKNGLCDCCYGDMYGKK